MSVLLAVLTVLMVLMSAFLVLIILLQRPRADSGMGAAIGGGGVLETTMGPESSNVLSKLTGWCSTIFFVTCLGIYLGYVHLNHTEGKLTGELPTIEAIPVVDPAAAPGAESSSVTVPAEGAPAAAATPEATVPAPVAEEAAPAAATVESSAPAAPAPQEVESAPAAQP